jgi:hypothetical protein
MNTSLSPREMTRLNGAAFCLGPEAFLDGWLDWLLDGLFGGSVESASCSEFNCNVYAPPPPPR